MKQGIYRGEFSIIHDGCEPSLASVIDGVDSYPLPLIPVWVTGGPPHIYDSANFSAYSWRDSYWVSVGIDLNPTTHVPASVDPQFERQWASMSGYVPITENPHPLDCVMRFDQRAHSRLTVSQPKKDTIEVRVDADWSDVGDCVDEAHYDIAPTLPRQACTESYVATYTLEQECEPPCDVDVGMSLYDGLDVDGEPQFFYDKTPTCVCPQ